MRLKRRNTPKTTKAAIKKPDSKKSLSRYLAIFTVYLLLYVLRAFKQFLSNHRENYSSRLSASRLLRIFSQLIWLETKRFAIHFPNCLWLHILSDGLYVFVLFRYGKKFLGFACRFPDAPAELGAFYLKMLLEFKFLQSSTVQFCTSSKL